MSNYGSHKKNILILSGFRIFPSNTGGHVHTGGIARSLARMGYRVTVYSLAGRKGDYDLRTVIRRGYTVDQIEENLVEETNLGLRYGLSQTIGRRLDRPRVWQYSLLRRGVIPNRLRQALQAADIILSDMPWCPRVPGVWSAKPWFLISHNLEHVLLEQSTESYRRYSAWMQDVERNAPSEYRDIFPCAQVDRDFFRANDPGGKLRLPMIRCGVDPKAYLVPKDTRERIRASLGIATHEKLVVFSGSNFGPNVEALTTLKGFSDRNADQLGQLGIKILVLGSVVATPFRAGPLIATGRVPEVAPYFAAADLGLNPVTRGSGANVKLFEYLATRLPVVSTGFGVRGTDLEPDTDYLRYEGDGLLDVLKFFVSRRDGAQWREFAEAVWTRHQRSCDIQLIVESAVGQRSEFTDSRT